ncbi:conserved hypothetical protein [Desulfosarcina cetonica]|nr:conserved hypothetical protein [Desulfosarcina cetonica]
MRLPWGLTKKRWTSNWRWYKRPILSKSLKMNGGDRLGSVIKKRRKKMRKHKHRKLLARTRHQRRKGK